MGENGIEMAWKKGLYFNEVSPRDLSLWTEKEAHEEEEEEEEEITVKTVSVRCGAISLIPIP
jgi:hypothetical protein